MFDSASDRLVRIYAQKPRPVALLAGVIAFAAIFGLHQIIRFAPALQSLYILPIWISTRLGGRRIGFLLVLVTAILGVLGETTRAGGATINDLLTDAVIRILSLGAIMLLFAQFEDTLTRYQIHARHDPLTGLLNRRALHEFAESALVKARRRILPFIVAVIDCDEFKAINDNHGHEAGDRALRLLAQVLESNIRSSDMVARVGGDEFVLIFQGSDEAEVKAVLTRINKAFVETVSRHGWRSSLSIGYAFLSDRTKTLNDLIQDADDAMYDAKQRKKQSRLKLM